jgi:hypothetical protein
MRRFSMFAAVFSVVWMVGSHARASEHDDAVAIERLRMAIEHRLPSGWSVRVEAAHRLSPHGDDESPALVISSKEKLATETVFAGSASGQEPLKQSEQLQIVLALRPYLTAEQYTRARAKNDSLIKERSEAERNLRGMLWAYKGGNPMPPSAFQPRNKREQRQTLEYALLWIRTRPERLPTHYWENFAFDVTPLDEATAIVDKTKDKEYQEIVKTLEGLLSSYETPMQVSN